ncbi:hypothetical protein PTKIN_Ptkin12aG0166100 [Pterospermum kingtungense]
MGQDIQAHDGSILTMKFSPDGQYLASAGEDGIVRVWQVVESERSGKSWHSLCQSFICLFHIFPQKVFRILVKPIHEFHGHCGDILDLSWSRNELILSSSVDKTVCLWQVGYEECQKVFPHSNNVTCVQFNPVDDDYFISGSIDGKVRIWTIPGCQVVDWTDVIDIVTDLCYRSDHGMGAIIGSMTGYCRFYEASGLRNAGSQVSASFTSDRMRIVSAIAMPWRGMMYRNSIFSNMPGTSSSPKFSSSTWRCNENNGVLRSELGESSQHSLPFSSS